MRLKWWKRLIQFLTAISGLAACTLAVFAYQLGIDHNPIMGSKRLLLLLAGNFLFLLAGLQVFLPILWHRLPGAARSKFSRMGSLLAKPFRWLLAPAADRPLPLKKHRRAGWFAFGGAALGIFISLWYITSGRLTTWTPSTTYFDRQANAFLSGQLWLLEDPPADLVALPDPYHYQNRAGVSGYLWDACLFEGKYTYYWGPVPALLAAAIKLADRSLVVQDQFLVFLSIMGIAIALAAILQRIKSHWLPALPGWLLFGLALMGVLNLPVFWLVNHPAVHEVPIATGQLFLVSGMVFALRAMQAEQRRNLWLTLAALCWGAAVACRLDLAPGVVICALILWIFLMLKERKIRCSISAVLALGLPLLFWAAGLAWYNHARFGNIFETGHRYQLTGGAMPANYGNILSPAYIPANLYNYLARPLDLHLDEFPFVFTPFITEHMWPRLVYPRDPNYFYNEPITGILIGIPSLWMLLFFALRPLKVFSNWLHEVPTGKTGAGTLSPPIFYGGMTAAAFLCNLAVLSVFLFSTMRYEADLLPLLTILVLFSLDEAAAFCKNRPRLWTLVLVAAGVLIILTILIALFGNFQNGDWLFKNSNPSLFELINDFFTTR